MAHRSIGTNQPVQTASGTNPKNPACVNTTLGLASEALEFIF